MPRTKVKKTTNLNREVNARMVLKNIREQKAEIFTKFQNELNGALQAYRAFANEQRCLIPYKYHNMTVREFINCKSNEASSTAALNCLSRADLLNITKSVEKDKSKRRALQKSSSFADAGYLTTESASSDGPKSRNTGKGPLTNRRSRSLSKSNILKVPTASNTPTNKPSPNSYGAITPKCKPNTPQALLRRPKAGEVALSLQGSPLYTASVVSDTMANINIPLIDGRLLTLQPQRGLRISQVPNLDPQIMSQLELLRENLNKVCAISGSTTNKK